MLLEAPMALTFTFSAAEAAVQVTLFSAIRLQTTLGQRLSRHCQEEEEEWETLHL